MTMWDTSEALRKVDGSQKVCEVTERAIAVHAR